MADAQELITKLNLVPHPKEGGHYAGGYISKLKVKPLDSAGSEERSCFDFIYFLIQNDNHIPWHRMTSSDEMFSYHKGSQLKLYLLQKDGTISTKILGDHLLDPQASYAGVVPANTWFAGELLDKEKSYGLFSITVCPAYRHEDCEFADVSTLAEQFPQHEELMRRFPAGPIKL